MSKPLLCKHGYGAFACPHCPAAARRGRGGAIPLMVEADRRRRELDDALSVLRELVALEDEPHPNGHTSEECYAWQGDYCQRNTAAWARARALVTERATDKEAT